VRNLRPRHAPQRPHPRSPYAGREDVSRLLLHSHGPSDDAWDSLLAAPFSADLPPGPVSLLGSLVRPGRPPAHASAPDTFTVLLRHAVTRRPVHTLITPGLLSRIVHKKDGASLSVALGALRGWGASQVSPGLPPPPPVPSLCTSALDAALCECARAIELEVQIYVAVLGPSASHLRSLAAEVRRALLVVGSGGSGGGRFVTCVRRIVESAHLGASVARAAAALGERGVGRLWAAPGGMDTARRRLGATAPLTSILPAREHVAGVVLRHWMREAAWERRRKVLVWGECAFGPL
jgi:hypothetical protein